MYVAIPLHCQHPSWLLKHPCSGVIGYILALSTSLMDIEGLLVLVYIADMAKRGGGGGILFVVVWCVLLMIPFPVITTLYFIHTK